MSDQVPIKAPRRPFPVRLLIWTVLVVGAGVAGIYLADELVLAPRRRMEAKVAKLELETVRLKTYLKLLEYTERRAQLEVISQSLDSTGETVNKLRFTELDPQGGVVGAQRILEIKGEEVYVDTLVIKFEDHFVELGDPLKGKALLLFRRIFTNRVRPDEGYVLDHNGIPPEIYAGRTATTPFERDLWARFWKVANSEQLAKQAGVKAMHGQAMYGRLVPNMVYTLVMRSTGEMTIPAPKAP
ncbi:MAG: hypothetical protein IPQ13_14825 [Holophagaceae bacterium]|nr:hypothetical protein [Holophagaceae bacterium]